MILTNEGNAIYSVIDTHTGLSQSISKAEYLQKSHNSNMVCISTDYVEICVKPDINTVEYRDIAISLLDALLLYKPSNTRFTCEEQYVKQVTNLVSDRVNNLLLLASSTTVVDTLKLKVKINKIDRALPINGTCEYL